MEGKDEPQTAPAAPPTGVPRPRWATVVGVLCILVASAQIAAVAGLMLMLPGWMVGLEIAAVALPILEHTAPLGAFLLGPWVGLVCTPLAAWLLLDGGISLLRRAPEARKLLLACAGIVIAGRVSAAVAGFSLLGRTPPPAAVGLVWPVFVLVWMLRPSIRKETAAWV